MPGIPREVAKHTMKFRLGSKPVKQRLHHFDEEKRRAIGKEIVGIRKEIAEEAPDPKRSVGSFEPVEGTKGKVVCIGTTLSSE